MSTTHSRRSPEQVSTGIEGLDAILQGGLPKGRTTLIQGQPGTGKTTLGLHFLLEGVRQGERVLFITLSQTEEELVDIIRSHGWSLDGVEVAELSRRSVAERLATQQYVFRTADIELDETTQALREAVEQHRPSRMVFDSIGAVRVLAGGSGTRYWEEIAMLQQFLHEQGATVLLIDDIPQDASEVESQTMAHGVIRLTYENAGYGADRRTLRVAKMRSLPYLSGNHDFVIREGGIEVFPRLQKPEAAAVEWSLLSSGSPTIDDMLDEGMYMGTACLFVGTAGTGKTAMATLFLHAALERGEGAALFLFEEHPEMYLRRAEMLGFDLNPYVEDDRLHIHSIDTGEVSPGEFARELKECVDGGVRVVLIDSLTGYFHAMPQGELLVAQMHEMLRYLRRRGVLALVTVAQHGLIGPGAHTTEELSYIADTIVLLRYFESDGVVRKAVSILKKRYGAHQTTVRELLITSEGVAAGAPIMAVPGVLSGRTIAAYPESGTDLDVAGRDGSTENGSTENGSTENGSTRQNDDSAAQSRS